MTKPLIELISCASGEWEILRMNLGEDYESQGHSMSNREWIYLLKLLGYEVEVREISDEDMENGNY